MEKTYRVNVTVYHSFTVEAENEEQAHEIASYDVVWDDHIKDCHMTIEDDSA